MTRVLHVNKFLHRKGGAEAYMLDLAAGQVEDGHVVTYFGMAHRENPPLEYEDWFPTAVSLDPPPTGLLPRLATTARMVWSTSAARGVRAVVEDFRPDVAHLHNVYHQLSPSIVAALGDAGIPVVMTVHDYKLVCPSYQMLAGGSVCDRCVGGGVHHAVVHGCLRGSRPASAVVAFESGVHRATDAYRGVGAFIAPSRFMAAQLDRDPRLRDRVVVIPHPAIASATPSGASAGQSALGRPAEPFVLVAGRLAPEKGVDTAIDAVGHIAEARLVVAGDGPDRAELERRAAVRAPGRVTFLGRVDRATVTALMRDSAAVLVPSRWHENQPMTVLEAFAVGTPVVSSDLGGLPELVIDGVTGLVVPPDDVPALAAAVGRILGDPGWSAGLGRTAQHHAADAHDPTAHRRSVEMVYATLLSRGRAAAAAAVPA